MRSFPYHGHLAITLLHIIIFISFSFITKASFLCREMKGDITLGKILLSVVIVGSLGNVIVRIIRVANRHRYGCIMVCTLFYRRTKAFYPH